MSKVQIIFILSIWVAVLPYLGFPNSLKNTLVTISGLGLIYFSYMLYASLKTKEKKEKTFENFSENNNFNETETQ